MNKLSLDKHLIWPLSRTIFGTFLYLNAVLVLILTTQTFYRQVLRTWKLRRNIFRDINVFHNGKLRHAFATLAGHKILKKIVAPSLLSLFFCLFELNDCLPARAKRGMAIILPHRTKILNMRGLFEKNIFIKNCGITMERGNS